jgi:hypothetical protein
LRKLISFKDITIEWSVSGNGTGWLYYSDLPGVELALTGKKVLSEIDLEKGQFVFAGSLKHYLSQIGLGDWIAKMQRSEVVKEEN